MVQLTLDLVARYEALQPAEQFIIDVLLDGQEHSALEFKRGYHGQYLDSVSQRMGALRNKGFDIESTGRRGHAIASYRLVPPNSDFRAGRAS